jgi:hypothetical protein
MPFSRGGRPFLTLGLGGRPRFLGASHTSEGLCKNDFNSSASTALILGDVKLISKAH